MNQIIPGSVVVLKSGSFDMTVESMDNSKETKFPLVTCVYLDDHGEFKRITIELPVLELVPQDEKDESDPDIN